MPASSTDTAEIVDQPVSTGNQPADTPVAQSDDKGASSTPPEAKSMLEAVQAAVKPKDAPPASQTPETNDKSAPDPDKTPAEDKADEPSEEETRNWSAKTQQRFRKLSSDVRAAQGEIANLSPKAAEYDRIDAFVKQSGLQPETVRAALQFATALQHDPVAAHQRAMAIVQHLDPVIGNVLPPDLRTRVEQGYLTEGDARQLARSSAEANLSRQRLESTQRQQIEATQRADVQRAADASQGAVETWEQNKSRDPDWHLKQGEVAEQVELSFERRRRDTGNPQWFPTPDEAVKMADDALKRVNDRLKRFAPRAQEIRPAATDSSASNRATAEPKTMLDAIRMAVKR